ncbi:biotin-dependent carboxyltransferase family protein [Actinomycetospora chlora]|uniref:Biotin-dependent carboxyltransferase family protein n=1 Tax=Actinomycetospora chlora TaxID=663608 RepID=A0ABP9C626_9PSEU
MTAALTVLATGPLATVQDRGRPGRSDLGVGVSGAADRRAFALANRLVGNDPAAAGLEVTAGGLVVRAGERMVVAVTGAPGPVLVRRPSGRLRPAGLARPEVLSLGDELRLGAPDRGLRSYVTVRGGVDVPAVLGSRSTDVLAGLGPPPLRPGDVLPVGQDVVGPVPACDGVPVSAPDGGEVTLHAVPGPRADWFDADALRALFGRPWEVTPASNRVGMRLHGPELGRTPSRAGTELPSEGVARGAIQVPASGQPLVFLADHPVTGGYPVVAVLRDRDVDVAAQVRPGQRLRLRVEAPPNIPRLSS